VCTALQSRSITGGAGFSAALENFAAPATLHITANAPYPYQLSVKADEEDTELLAIRAFAERIAPANMQVLVGYTRGFIIGRSRIGYLI
jgi:hypothetical protein